MFLKMSLRSVGVWLVILKGWAKRKVLYHGSTKWLHQLLWNFWYTFFPSIYIYVPTFELICSAKQFPHYLKIFYCHVSVSNLQFSKNKVLSTTIQFSTPPPTGWLAHTITHHPKSHPTTNHTNLPSNNSSFTYKFDFKYTHQYLNFINKLRKIY